MVSRRCLSVILSLCSLGMAVGQARAQTDLVPTSAIERLNLQRYWELALSLAPGESVSGIKLLEDNLYVMTSLNKAYAVHSRTGVVRWSADVAGQDQTVRGPSHTPLYALFTTPAGIRIFNRQSGEFLAEPRQLKGVIVDVTQDSATVTVGLVQGVRNGDVFKVYHAKSRVEAEDTSFAQLRITAIEQYQSKGRFLNYDRRRPAASGDRVEANVELPLENVKLPFAASSAAVSDDTWVYVGAANERFYCRALLENSLESSKDWQLMTPGTVSATPVLMGQMLVIAGQDGKVICLDKTEHRRNWTFQTEGPIFANLAVTPKQIFVASSDQWLYCLDTATGRRLWRQQFDSPLRDPPVVQDNRVYQQVPGKGLVVLSTETGERLWVWPEKAEPLVQMDGEVYLLSGDGAQRLIRVDPKTGKAKTTVEAGAVAVAAGHQADQMLILVSKAGQLLGLRSAKAPRLKPEELAEVLRDSNKIKLRAQIATERQASTAETKPTATAGGKKGSSDWLDEDWLRSSRTGGLTAARRSATGKTAPAEKPKAAKKTEDEDKAAKAEEEPEESEKAEAEEEPAEKEDGAAEEEEGKDEEDAKADESSDEDEDKAGDDEEESDDEGDEEGDDEGGGDEGGKTGGGQGGGGGSGPQPPGGGGPQPPRPTGGGKRGGG